VLRGDAAAAKDLRFVGFDVLALGGEDLRGRSWTERNLLLTDALPVSGRVRRVESLPASPAAHAAIVALGFEGTVLKRPSSRYRPGRRRVWLKHKARYAADGVLLSVRQGRDGQWHGACDIDGLRVSVLAGASWADRIGEVVTLVYSRVDADGDLREVRIAGSGSSASVAA
jgi:ATP-dependent DNA ligase